MVKQIVIADHFYLWTPESGVTSTVVVSCHGGMLDSVFVAPQGSVFKFYSAPTESAYGALDITLWDDKVAEIKDCSDARPNWRTVDDYSLSKFQGKHGGNSETYGDIRVFVNQHDISVLSVRNRKSLMVNKSDSQTYFSRAVGQIETKYPGQVREYRCLFCRVDMNPAMFVNAFTGEKFL